MPKRPLKPCSAPHCPELVEAGQGGKCEKHRKAQRTVSDKEYELKRRGKEERKIYWSTHWRRLRKVILNNEPLCRHCKAENRLVPGTEVDHIDGNPWNMETDNLQALCKSCHSKKTAKEQGGGWKS